jgi:hypothetical protein
MHSIAGQKQSAGKFPSNRFVLKLDVYASAATTSNTKSKTERVNNGEKEFVKNEPACPPSWGHA